MNIEQPDFSGVGQASGHVVAVGVVISSFIGWLPGVAALLAVIWYVIQIKESQTFQTFLENRRQSKRIKLLVALAALDTPKKRDNDDGSGPRT